MAGKSRRPVGIRLINLALVDEGGRRWEFDVSRGWSRNVRDVIADVRPTRVLEGHYSDTRDVGTDPSAVTATLSAQASSWQAGVYRSGGESIVYLARD